MVSCDALAPTPVRPMIYGTDEDSCRKRRRVRMDIIRRKRQRCMANIPSHHTSCDSSVSSDSFSVYTLTKDEIRRKKNRESAERSRLRKLGLIDYLTKQTETLSAQLHKLCARNECLRSNGGDLSSRGSVSSSAYDSDGGDLSTISTASISSSSSASSSPASSTQLPAGKSLLSHHYDTSSVVALQQSNHFLQDADLHFEFPAHFLASTGSDAAASSVYDVEGGGCDDFGKFAWLPVMDDAFQFSELLDDFDCHSF